MSDELAVMIEPVACGVHAALRSGAQPGDTVAVVGAGTMGLVAVAALRGLTEPASILVGARYSTQRALALEFGADSAVEPGELKRAAAPGHWFVPGRRPPLQRCRRGHRRGGFLGIDGRGTLAVPTEGPRADAGDARHGDRRADRPVAS